MITGSKRRDRLEIIVDIIECCKTETRKTGIVYGTNLNFKLANGYLKSLVGKGFLEKKGNKFSTTGKGLTFLEKAKEFQGQL